MRGRLLFLACLLSLAALALCSCRPSGPQTDRDARLKVVTTLFPLYDFARNVGGSKAAVTLLVPPGVEPHSFEPKPGDILKIHQADMFVYTGDFMEPWAASIVRGAEKPSLVVVDSSRGALLRREAESRPGGAPPGEASPQTGDRGHVDPHIWLDLGNAQVMVDNILKGFVEKDPGNGAFYEKNAAAYRTKLAALDARFGQGLASCETRTFVHGGHYAFHYLALRYRLKYLSVYGFSPDAEPSPRHLARIVQEIRSHKIKYIFYEELLQPRMAETIARETGARLLPLNGGHNVTRDELAKGVTFISLLDQDLQSLRTGLECR